MAFDWTSIAETLITTGGNVASSAITKQPVGSSAGWTGTATPPFVGGGMTGAAGVLQNILPGLIQPSANQVVTQSFGAVLKKYWWVIAIPAALLLALLVKPLFNKRKSW